VHPSSHVPRVRMQAGVPRVPFSRCVRVLCTHVYMPSCMCMYMHPFSHVLIRTGCHVLLSWASNFTIVTDRHNLWSEYTLVGVQRVNVIAFLELIQV
jgi:hypothetical protein